MGRWPFGSKRAGALLCEFNWAMFKDSALMDAVARAGVAADHIEVAVPGELVSLDGVRLTKQLKAAAIALIVAAG